MEKAVRQVKEGKSVPKAARDNHIPRETLRDTVGGLHKKRCGGQLYLTDELETALVSVLDQLSSWKYPLTSYELRCLVRNYITSCNIESKFKDNMPGWDWAKGFIQRHKLAERFATNLKPQRAKITKEEVLEYFDNLEESLDGIEPANIFNFDETNFTDDPKRSKCICRPGRSRHERVESHSKTGFSVMFCGSATGEYLPPMVVYKAKNMYEGWASDVIPGAVYGSSESGWFDMDMFEKWFFQVFLPHAIDLIGKKSIVGDNLASHFSPKVIASCVKNNIQFVPLVKNSTSWGQPLDVAVFGPMKRMWRTCLLRWRRETRSAGTVPKGIFPLLLSRVYRQLKGSNLIAGFKASGIVPLDSRPVLKHLVGPQTVDPQGQEMVNVLNEACMKLLSESLGLRARISIKAARGCKVTAGKAIRCPETVWQCNVCEGKFSDDEEGDGDRWIICDNQMCNIAVHLQCSDIEYGNEDTYWDFDLDGIDFLCVTCKTKERKKSKKGKKGKK